MRKLLNIRNLIIVCIIVVLAVIILEQQSVLDSKNEAYESAKNVSAQIEELGSRQELKSDVSGSASEEEEYLRNEGYIYPGEIVISYDNR